MITSTRFHRRLIGILLVLAFMSVFSACTRYRGYGVLVWKNESLPFQVGELVNIASIFNVDDYYEADSKGTLVQIKPMWNVQYFDSIDDAKKFQTTFLPFANLYVFTQKPEGLPIRNEPQSTASVIFKLKTGIVAKVIGRDKERTRIDQFNDYWYWILTKEGYRGYVYGYYLKTVETSSANDEKLTKLIESDPALDAFMKSVWIPAKTADMLSSGRIDVTYLEKKYALTPKPDENKITLKNEDMEKEFSYTAIKKISGDTYELVGTDLKVQIFPSEKIYLSYFLNGAFITREFALAKTNLDDLVNKQTGRSQNILSKFLNRGTSLSSTSYGTITLDDRYGFVWNDFGALKSILPPSTIGKGTVNFNRFLGRQAAASANSLAGPFEGAISFVFAEAPEFDVTFVYSFLETGVRLVYVSKENIVDNEVRRIGSSPLVIFFSFEK
jgi:hypothetical protein